MHKLNKATLINRNLKTGEDFILDEIPLGKTYYVDLTACTTLTFLRPGDRPPVTLHLDCVLAYDTPQGGYGGFLPLELLRVETDA